jgi:hypothetical protein
MKKQLFLVTIADGRMGASDSYSFMTEKELKIHADLGAYMSVYPVGKELKGKDRDKLKIGSEYQKKKSRYIF